MSRKVAERIMRSARWNEGEPLSITEIADAGKCTIVEAAEAMPEIIAAGRAKAFKTDVRGSKGLQTRYQPLSLAQVWLRRPLTAGQPGEADHAAN